MIQYSYTFTVPDNADHYTILNAIAQAGRSEQGWKKKKVTDLTNKCGSCKHFGPYPDCPSAGCCFKGHSWGPRSRPACGHYEEVTQ